MNSPVNHKETLAVVRLLELVSPNRPWYRALWGIGINLALEELYEACIAMRQGHLSEGSLNRMISSLKRRIGAHPCFTKEEKQFLTQHLNLVPRAEGVAHFSIRELAQHVARDYMLRWKKAVELNEYRVEHFARNVAAHLLDLGFSSQYIHEIVKKTWNSDECSSLATLCNVLHDVIDGSCERNFEILICFRSGPLFLNGVPESWFRGPQISEWLRSNNSETTGLRSQFALVLNVKARDAMGAAAQARIEIDRFQSRSIIATGQKLEFHDQIWVKGIPNPLIIKEDLRGVSVKELFREERIFSPDTSDGVDAALEMLAHLESSSPAAAVAGGWGAIEGLLADPSDRASAADNLALLVTCSYPRAELTALSYKVQTNCASYASLFNPEQTNRDRSKVLAGLLREDKVLRLQSKTDEVALQRMKKIINNPSRKLQIIRDEIGDSFHRLYRQRNLILHGARLDSVVLSASLRTVSKLVGAGMDRITHGHYVQGLRPLELVAKANLAVALSRGDSSIDCVDLLEDV